MRIRMVDMVSNNKNKSMGELDDISVADITSLPANFTSKLTAAACTSSAAVYCDAKALASAKRIGIQVIVPTKGAGFSGLAVQLQESNVGGAEAKVWNDVASATASISDVGSATVGIANTRLRTSRFYRLVLTASGGTCTAYAVACCCEG